jgi:hypothetical protein
MSFMVERMAEALKVANDFWGCMPRSDAHWRAMAHQALFAAKYRDGADESIAITVASGQKIDAVCVAEVWDAMIEEALNG